MDNPNFTTSSYWSHGYLADISAWSGSNVRIAFQYYGLQYDDKWYMDDICIGIEDVVGSPPSTCFYSEGFEIPGYPLLPPGWTVFDGPANDTTQNWRTSYDNFHTGITAALHEYPLAGETADSYLVSPPISLP